MAGLWDMFNWYSWYLPPSSEPEEETSIIEEVIPKKKKRITRTKKKISEKDGIQLVLLPPLLEELEKEAKDSDSTLNQLIENILKDHIESKKNRLESETWQCNYCEPQVEFEDYFKYSEHFFAAHLQPSLQKLTKVNYNH